MKVAAQKAREKADVLAQALEVTLVRILKVTEGRNPLLPRRHNLRMAMSESSEVPLSPGELTIRATVNLVFEIRNK